MLGAPSKSRFALELDNSSPAADFYEKLGDRDKAKMLKMFKQMGDAGKISNKEKFKKLADDLYELKSFQIGCCAFFCPEGCW